MQLVYNGHADHVTYHIIDGGAGDDVIVVRDFGNQFTVDAVTGKETRSEIRGGDGNDVIFSIGAGIGGEVVGGAGRDLIFGHGIFVKYSCHGRAPQANDNTKLRVIV